MYILMMVGVVIGMAGSIIMNHRHFYIGAALLIIGLAIVIRTSKNKWK